MKLLNNKINRLQILVWICLGLGILGIVAALVSDITYRPGLLLLLIGGSFAMMNSKTAKSFSFTAWVIVCVSFALAYPQLWVQWGSFKLSLLIVPLIQLIMFGMGTTLSLSDFSRILLSPWAVLVGVLLQFGLMPFVGYLVASQLGFSGEIAAGIVLVGSVSGGVASNLMAYIAGANVALSVTMTVVSTILAPIMTPVLMASFAGSFIEIDTFAMMLGVINIIVIPVVVGLLANHILYSDSKWAKNIPLLIAMMAVSSIVLWLGLGSDLLNMGSIAALKVGIIMGSVLVIVVCLSQLIIGIRLQRSNRWLDQALPMVSKIGICIILAVIIGQTYGVLVTAGGLLVLAAVIHNTVGYIMGYYCARGAGFAIGKIGYSMGWLETSATRIDEASCRTVALEVGMQNSGMATGLALDVLKSHLAALPANIFGTWMNISGSVLANYWKLKDDKVAGQTAVAPELIKS